MASGAGLNHLGGNGGELLVTTSSSATAYTTPYTGYGTIGMNDSGACCLEGIGFSKWIFQIVGPGSQTAGYTFSVYGTIDPAARPNGTFPTPKQGATVVPATSWFLLPGPSEQSGTGVMANPMVSGTSPVLYTSIPLVAVRVVLTAIGTPTATVSVLAFAVP